MKIITWCLTIFVTLGFTQESPHPTKVHVKKVGDSYVKYTSKLVGGKALHLNFTMGFHHSDGKPIIKQQIDAQSEQEGFEVTYLVGGTDGTVNGQVPDFDLDLLREHQLILTNNISGFGNSALSTNQKSALETAVSEDGIGYLGWHASGDYGGGGWQWYSNSLHPMKYGGHGERTEGKIYKHPEQKDHIILDGILEEGMTMGEVPNETDDQGNEILTELPYRHMKNEWYRFGQQIADMEQYKNDVTILTKYDGRVGEGANLPTGNIRKGGNMYTYLFKVGNALTSYTPAGHHNDELMATGSTFDGGYGDYDRYHIQLMYFLAGYDLEVCSEESVDCEDGLQIIDDNSHFTGGSCGDAENECEIVNVIYNGNSVPSPKYQVDERSVQIQSETLPHTIKISNVKGSILQTMEGKGNANYTLNKLEPGIHFVQIQFPGMSPVIKKVFIQ